MHTINLHHCVFFSVRLKSLLLISILFALQASVWARGISLRLATQEFEPFSYEENGHAAGPLVEVMEAICEAASVTCNIDVLPWRRATDEAERGRIDGLFPILPTAEREKWVYFSDPVAQTAYSFFVQQDSRWTYHSPADLTGMKIGVYGPSGTSASLESAVIKNANATIEIVLNNATALKMLAAGRFGQRSAVLANRDVGLALIRKEKLDGLKPAGDLQTISYSIGFSRRSLSSEQIRSLNKALQRLKKSGKIKEILAKYGLEAAGVAKGAESRGKSVMETMGAQH